MQNDEQDPSPHPHAKVPVDAVEDFGGPSIRGPQQYGQDTAASGVETISSRSPLGLNDTARRATSHPLEGTSGA